MQSIARRILQLGAQLGEVVPRYNCGSDRITDGRLFSLNRDSDFARELSHAYLTTQIHMRCDDSWISLIECSVRTAFLHTV